MFFQILLPSTGAASDAIVFETARAVVGRDAMHLHFLFARPDPADAAIAMSTGAMDGGYAVAGLIETMEQEGRIAEAAARSAWGIFSAAKVAPESDFEAVVGNTADMLVIQGRTSDLVVMGREHGGEAVALGLLQAVLGGVWRPLLIAGTRCPGSLLRTVLIAWKDTAEAARAVCAAMPFIDAAERAVVLGVGEAAGEVASLASAERLVATLARQAPLVHARHMPAGPEGAAQTMLAAAAELDAGLVVMDGYGHGESRESLVGGFTRTVLGGADLPVLMMR